MSMLMMARAFGIKVGNANRKLVLLKLADNANDHGECFPSYQHIADQCEMGRSTVKAHIKALSDAGYLVIQERKLSTHQSSNIYRLTLEEGVASERKKPTRPGKAKGSTADRGQPLTGGGSTADLPPRSTADPRTYHSFESVIEPKPLSSSDELNDAFEKFWWAGMVKVGKPKAKAAFKRKAKSSTSPGEFADMLANDVAERLKAGQFGFDRMHPTTYLNGERWNDEISKRTTEERNGSGRADPLEQFEQARRERDQQCEGRLGMEENDRDLWGNLDQGAGQGSVRALGSGYGDPWQS